MRRKFAPIIALLCAASCSNGIFDGYYDYTDSPSPEAPGSHEGGNSEAGVLTAGEWNDLNNWDFWSSLLLNNESEGAKSKTAYWGFYPDARVAVQISCESADKSLIPAAGAAVELLDAEGQILWSAVTTNSGAANLWPCMYDREQDVDFSQLRLKIDGALQDAPVEVTFYQDKELKINEFTLSESPYTDNSADIAFIVDATGSMSDEIDFLKSDLVDILKKAGRVDTQMTLRTAALFYRDEGDDYLTRHQDFSTDINSTVNFVKEQSADGGGDYPEAVHTALERGLQDLSWNENAYAKLAFLILDAPAHYKESVLESLHGSIRTYARNGIAIIPVAASGVDKSTEFMLRCFAIATDGTYTFLTNDSGVGGDHIKPTVGDYKIEQLNDLLTRIIEERIQ